MTDDGFRELPEPLWYSIARREIGVHETPGPGSTARIEEYLAATRLPESMRDDQTPWCAAFVGWCLQRAGKRPSFSAAARSYLGWGKPLAEPTLGCVVVLSRPGAGHPGAGHVGFFQSVNARRVRLVGGNQANSVCSREYALTRVLGYRWPS